MDTIIIVDPIRSGQKLINASLKLGYNVLAVMTLSDQLLRHLNEYEGEEIKEYNSSLIKMTLYTNSFQAVIDYVKRKKLKIHAVIPATDPGINLADQIGHHFNVVHNDIQTSLSRIDKGVMRKSVEFNALKQPKYFVMKSIHQLSDATSLFSYPIVLKPPRSAGTNLVTVCNCKEEAKYAAQNILNSINLFGRRSDSVVIEEYVSGPEYAVNLFAQNGKQYLIDVMKYVKYNNSHGNDIYYSIIQTSDYSPDVMGLIQYAKEVANAVGVSYGPSHVEVRLTKEGPMLMEIGSRFPGVKIPELWEESLSVNPFELAIQTFLGKDQTKELENIRFGKRFRIEFCGIDHSIECVNEIHGIGAIEQLHSYHSHELSVEVNQRLDPSIDLESIPILIRLQNSDKSLLDTEADLCHELFKIL